jgi:ribosomal protein S18 acetylase RimI-like enzyme
MYTVARCTDRAALRYLLNADPIDAAYALGDLDEAFWPQAEFWGAQAAHGELLAILLFYHGFEVPTLSLHGHLDAVAQLLAQVPLAPEVFCMCPAIFRGVLGIKYQTPKLDELYRMVVHAESFRPQVRPLGPGQHLRRLEAGDVDRLNALYQQAADPGETILAFSPPQVAQGVFFGVEDHGGALLAVAGTHLVAQAEGVAAVGNIFTQPAARGAGLGTLTTAAVTSELLQMGIANVVLNVKTNNPPAIHIYESLGYRVHSEIIEGPGQLIG